MIWNEEFTRKGFGPIWMVVYDGMYNLRAPGARPQKVLWHYAKFRKNAIELSKHKREITDFDNNRPLLFMPSK
jgi:hypothetical protein